MQDSGDSKTSLSRQATQTNNQIPAKTWVLYGVLFLALTQVFLWLADRFWRFLAN